MLRLVNFSRHESRILLVKRDTMDLYELNHVSVQDSWFFHAEYTF